MRPIKDTPPPPDSFMARRRPTLRSGQKRKVSFEITPHAHEMLRTEADRRGLTQIMLVELMIRHYCDPEKVKHEPERAF